MINSSFFAAKHNNKAILLAIALIFLVIYPASGNNVDQSWVYNRQGIRKINDGKIDAAIRDFEKACQLNPFNDTALANLAGAHNNLGVVLAQKRNFTEAIRQFEIAMAQKPEDISIRLNLLSTFVTIKQAAKVEALAEEILRLRPDDTEIGLKVAAAYQKTENPMAAMTTLLELSERNDSSPELFAALARIYYRNGNFRESIYHLGRSLELQPDNSEMLTLQRRIRREEEVKENSQTYTSVNFELVCHNSFSAEWASRLLVLLEQAYVEIGEKLNFYPSQRSQVLVMETRDFRNVHDLPDWAGGVYDGKIRLPVPAATPPENLRGAIRHEYTHHVIFLLSASNCPVWLNEGLAQIFEFDTHPWQLQSLDLSLNELDRFVENLKNSQSHAQASKLYTQAQMAASNFVYQYGWPIMAEILARLGKGYSMQEAVEISAGADTAELKRVAQGL